MVCMRGFVITILSVSLIMVLVALAMSLRNIHAGTERSLMEPLPLIYASFLLDDVAYELNSLVGPGLALNETNDSIRLAISDSLHTANHSAEILAYRRFLESEVADSTVSNITVDFTNLTGGTISLSIDGDYSYANDHNASEALFTRSDGTGATSYDINFTVYSVRQNVTHMEFNSSGTLNVTIHYTDLNCTATEQGAVFPGSHNSLLVVYPNGTSMEVSVGAVGGNSGSLKLKATGPGADVSFSVVLPPLNETRKLGYDYNATIAYVQGRVAKHCRIGK